MAHREERAISQRLRRKDDLEYGVLVKMKLEAGNITIVVGAFCTEVGGIGAKTVLEEPVAA